MFFHEIIALLALLLFSVSSLTTGHLQLRSHLNSSSIPPGADPPPRHHDSGSIVGYIVAVIIVGAIFCFYSGWRRR